MSSRWRLALFAALCLAAASPPAWWPGAEFAVFLGLGGLYACSTSSTRPYLIGYAVGLIRFGFFSWSLIGVAGGGYVAVILLGAVYEVAIVAWTRGAMCWRRGLGAIGFGCGVAATGWLRAHAPEIPYPHGQVSHALFGWSNLLGPVEWGGEVLANLLCAWLAAAFVDLFRAWRDGRPGWVGARRQFGAVVALWAGSCLFSPPRPAAPPKTLDFAAIEPGPNEVFGFGRKDLEQAIQELLVDPTRAIAGPQAVGPPALVIWPESTVPAAWVQRLPFRLARGTALIGAAVLREAGRDFTACVLFRADGVPLGWQEKQIPVPAAERMPGLEFLPESMIEWGAGIVGYMPRLQPGRWRPALELGDGTRFGTLVCFDNAFDSVSRRHVAQGARFLAVLSNEYWYGQGAELDQMVAMSVFRALETGTPVIRATTDGRTVAVSAAGVITPPPAPADTESGWPRILRVELELGPGALGPLAWLHPAIVWLVVASGLASLRLFRRK